MTDKPKEIDWTAEKLSSFKKAYAKALKRKASQRESMFVWEGYQFIPGYAKYLIKYLEYKFDSNE